MHAQDSIKEKSSFSGTIRISNIQKQKKTNSSEGKYSSQKNSSTLIYVSQESTSAFKTDRTELSMQSN